MIISSPLAISTDSLTVGAAGVIGHKAAKLTWTFCPHGKRLGTVNNVTCWHMICAGPH